MMKLEIFTLVGLVGLFASCSSDDENDNNGAPTGSATGTSTGTTTGAATGTTTGTVWVPVDDAQVSGDTIVLDDGTQVPIVTQANGDLTGTLPDGTIVYVMADGTVVTAAPAATDWDVNVPTDACVDTSAGADSAPAILQFVIDKSTSMNETAPSTNGDSKWGATREALNLSYPTMDPTLAVGEFFYPNATGGCVQPNGGVDIAPLTDAQVQALIDGANAIADPTSPAGTPTHDAWREGLRRLQLVLANPPPGYETAKGYVVLMTDGMPVRTLNCGQAAGDNIAVTEEQFNEFINDVAQTTAATGIQTFVIGVPGSENDNQVPTDPSGNGVDYVPRTKLSEVAIAGQTAIAGCNPDGPNYCHIDMVEDPDFVEGLRAARPCCRAFARWPRK